MKDIEDLIGGDEGSREASPVRQSLPGVVLPKRRSTVEAPSLPQQQQRDSFVPGCATVYTRTWGCGHNASDGV